MYLMLHKPAGLLSATEDRNQKTVLDLLPEHLRRRGLFPVGRLDKDTEGLLLLTETGPWATTCSPRTSMWTRCTTPRWTGRWTRPTRRPWPRDGAGGRPCLPARRSGAPGGRLGVPGHPPEGKYHQVKRMLAARGKPVRYLKRLSMGPIRLDPALGPGSGGPSPGRR